MSDRPSVLFLAITPKEYAPSNVRNYGVSRTFHLIPHKHSILALTAWLRQHGCVGYYIWINPDDPDGLDRILQFIEDKKPDAIGLSLVTEELIAHHRLIEKIKEKFPHVPVIAGGPHVSAEPVHTLENFPLIDYVCIGEGERTLTEWLKMIAKGKSTKDMRQVRGLAFRDNSYGVAITSPREKFNDINILPDPAFDLIAQRERNLFRDSAFPLVGSYGCRHFCAFCAADHGNYRFMTPERIVDQIERAQREFGVGYFSIRDSFWPPSKVWCDRFCDLVELKKLQFQFHFETRAGTLDLRQMIRLKNIGAIAVAVGVESGDPDMLKAMRKGITLDMARRTFADLHKAGILSIAFFMLGFPGETYDTIDRSAEFARELNPTLLSLATFRPLPGTEIHRHIAEDDKYWWMKGEYPTVGEIPINELKRIHEEMHIRYPLNIAYLKQHVYASRLPAELRKVAYSAFRVHLRKYVLGILERYSITRELIRHTRSLIRRYS